MTSREQFEAIAGAQGYDLRRSMCSDGYFDERVHHMWRVHERTWQAAYAAGQEAMRERLTRHTAPMTARGEYRRGFLDAIAALRALEIER